MSRFSFYGTLYGMLLNSFGERYPVEQIRAAANAIDSVLWPETSLHAEIIEAARLVLASRGRDVVAMAMLRDALDKIEGG